VPGKKEAYIRAVARLVRETNNLEGDALWRAVELLEGAHGRIEEALLTGGTEWEVARLQRLRTQVEATMQDFARRYAAEFRGRESTAWELGERMVDDPLGAYGVSTTGWPMLSRARLEILQGFSADLITNMSQDSIRRITGVITRAAMTEMGPAEAMAEITRLFGMMGITRTGPWRATGILYRAELITRTELLRTFSLSTQARLMQAVELVPGMGKRWVATGDSRTRASHLAAHGQVVPAGGKFRVGGWECDYPRDPALPPAESCNCRCRHVAWLPEFGEEWGALDERIQRLMRR